MSGLHAKVATIEWWFAEIWRRGNIAFFKDGLMEFGTMCDDMGKSNPVCFAATNSKLQTRTGMMAILESNGETALASAGPAIEQRAKFERLADTGAFERLADGLED